MLGVSPLSAKRSIIQMVLDLNFDKVLSSYSKNLTQMKESFQKQLDELFPQRGLLLQEIRNGSTVLLCSLPWSNVHPFLSDLQATNLTLPWPNPKNNVARVQKIILPEKTLCGPEEVATELKVMDATEIISARVNGPSSVAKLDEFVSKYGMIEEDCCILPGCEILPPNTESDNFMAKYGCVDDDMI